MMTMQRPTGLPRNQRLKRSPRPRVKNVSNLQIDNHYSDIGRREHSSWSQLLKKYSIHGIPVIVLLCFVVLWWFFYPVNLEIKDGRIIAVHPIEMPQPVNNTSFDLAILAVSISPDVPIPQKLAASTSPDVPIPQKLAGSTSPDVPIPQILALNNETEVEPVMSQSG